MKLGSLEGSRATTAKKCTKKLDAHAKLLFCLLPAIGVVTLDVFPRAAHGEIAWDGFALGFDHFHVCSHTTIKCPRGRKKKLEPSFAGNVVVII